jgi:hypothetical protein
MRMSTRAASKESTSEVFNHSSMSPSTRDKTWVSREQAVEVARRALTSGTKS